MTNIEQTISEKTDDEVQLDEAVGRTSYSARTPVASSASASLAPSISVIPPTVRPPQKEKAGPDTLTEPLIGRLVDKSKRAGDVICAAWVIEDALEGYHALDYPSGDEAKRLRKQVHRLFHLKKAFFWSTVTLVALMFVEVPLWCKPELPLQQIKWTAVDYCPVKDDQGEWLTAAGFKDVMFSDFVMPPKYSMLLEAIAMSVMTITLLYELQLSLRLGQKRGLPGSEPVRFLFILLLMWTELVLYYNLLEKGQLSVFRFTSYGRLLLLFYGPRVRSVFRSVFNCLDEFASAVIFLVGCVIFFAYLLYAILDDLHDASGASVAEVSGDGDNFGSFDKTLISFFTMMTGAAFPDYICLILKQSRLYAFIFYPFMTLSAFLFMNLMLAIVYNAYSGETKDRLLEYYTERTKGVVLTFRILSVHNAEGEAVVEKHRFSSLIEVLAGWPRFRGRLRKEDAAVLFQALDDDNSGELTLNEFFDACSTMLYSINNTRHKTDWVYHSNGGFMSKLDHFVENNYLGYCTEFILVCNAIFIGVQSWYDFSDRIEPWYFKDISFFFTMIYMLEVAVKLSVYSFSFYWANAANRFDFAVSWLLFFVGGLDYCRFGKGRLNDLIRYFNILRILRLLRLLTQVPWLWRMCVCIAHLCQIAGDMVILFFVSTTFFAVIGVQLFGGLLYKGAPHLADSDYLAAGYDILNFNDMLGGMLTLVDMQINGYMPEYAQAIDMVLPLQIPFIGPKIGEFFCGAVFLLSVNIAFNIFTAFLIDIFVSLQEAELKEEAGEEKEEERNLASMKDQVKERGEVLHFTESPELLRMKTLAGIVDVASAVQKAQEAALTELHRLQEEQEDLPRT